MTSAVVSPASLDRILARPVKALSEADLRILFDRWQEDRDPRARGRLVERFMPLARALARRYANSHEPIEDLVGVANLALVKAIDRFDTSRELSFTSFAVPTILGELRRYFRDMGWSVHVPRGRQEAALKVEKAARELTSRTGQDPSPQLLAEYLEWSLEAVIEALEAGAGHFSTSLDAPVRDEEGEVGSVLSTIGQVDDAYETIDARLTIVDAIGRLPVPVRRVIAMRFVEGLTQQQIGDRLGVSQMQISRVLRQARNEIRALTDPSD